jgi:hypothetical protein
MTKYPAVAYVIAQHSTALKLRAYQLTSNDAHMRNLGHHDEVV